MNWSAPKRPVDHAEHALITAILAGDFVPGSALPAERELAGMIGVTRPTLREALRRLERDGWLVVQQGKATTVTDFWRDGGLNVLNGIARHSSVLPDDFVPNLLQVRLDLAPTYTRLAVTRAPERVAGLLKSAASIDDTPPAYAAYDWQLQRLLTVESGNAVYALIFNSFAGFYEQMAALYFAGDEARQVSRVYYADLQAAVERGDAAHTETITRDVMRASIDLWQRAAGTKGEQA